MNKMLDSLEHVLTPLAHKIGSNKYLIAIRDGFLLSTPLLIIGSLFILIANFPLPQWDVWMTSLLGENWAKMMSVPANASFDVMAILATFGIAYSFGKQIKTDAIQAGILAVVIFFMVTPFYTLYTPEGASEAIRVTSLPLTWMGSKGLFLGMIIALVSTKIFANILARGWTIKMPEGVPPAVTRSFEALIPAACVIIPFFILNWIIVATGLQSLQVIIFNFLQTPLLKLGNTLPAMIIAYIFLHFFWFFGINGGSVVGAVFNPVLRALSMQNLDAFKAHEPLPNIITGQFQDMFATFGGAGSTLSLILVMIFFMKSQRIKTLARLSIAPGIFGINEPIIFGLPIVLNPVLLIPFVLVPTVNIIIAYYAMDWGLVAYTNGIQIPWTTPVIISGFLVSGWQASVLQFFLLLLGMILYYPFIKVMDKQYLEEEAEAELKAAEELIQPTETITITEN